MLLMLCLATTKKLGHQVSLSLECKAVHSKMEYRKKPILPKYSIKIVQLPAHDTNEDLGALVLNPSEKDLMDLYQLLFDKKFGGNITDTGYRRFKSEIQVLLDLIDDQKYSKKGSHSAAYENGQKHAYLTQVDARALYDGFVEHQVGRLTFTPDVTHVTSPEGWTIRSCLADQAVFESADKIKIVVGPRQNQTWENFTLATSVDDLNLSTDFLTRAGIVAGITGYQKDLELIVVGAPGITEADIRKKVDSILHGREYAQQLHTHNPNEVNVSMMGSMGISAAWHYHTKKFIYTVRSGLDHTWGKFCQTAPKGTNTENNPSLGLGGYVGIGADYKWTEKTAIGLEGGVRLNQLKIPRLKNQEKKSSMWFTNPYAQVNCTFFGDDDTSLGLFSGYIFAKEFVITSTGSRIPYGSPCKISGLYGGMRLSKYF